MKKYLITMVMLMSCIMAWAQMVYTPYYAALGRMVDGKVSWDSYQSVESSSIFVERDKMQFNIGGLQSITLTGYQKVSKGKTANGQYNYYEGLTTSNGIKANVRVDFLGDDWVIFSLYMPSVPNSNCVRAKCKFLTDLDEGASTVTNTKSNETAAQRKQKIQGSYIASSHATMGDADMIHQYGRYIIKGDEITKCSWSSTRNAWVKDYSAPYKLEYYYDNDYMGGYNIVFKDKYGDQVRICTGDTDGDGRMDLWMTDGFFYTKQ